MFETRCNTSSESLSKSQDDVKSFHITTTPPAVDEDGRDGPHGRNDASQSWSKPSSTTFEECEANLVSSMMSTVATGEEEKCEELYTENIQKEKTRKTKKIYEKSIPTSLAEHRDVPPTTANVYMNQSILDTSEQDFHHIRMNFEARRMGSSAKLEVSPRAQSFPQIGKGGHIDNNKRNRVGVASPRSHTIEPKRTRIEIPLIPIPPSSFPPFQCDLPSPAFSSCSSSFFGKSFRSRRSASPGGKKFLPRAYSVPSEHRRAPLEMDASTTSRRDHKGSTVFHPYDPRGPQNIHPTPQAWQAFGPTSSLSSEEGRTRRKSEKTPPSSKPYPGYGNNLERRSTPHPSFFHTLLLPYRNTTVEKAYCLYWERYYLPYCLVYGLLLGFALGTFWLIMSLHLSWHRVQCEVAFYFLIALSFVFLLLYTFLPYFIIEYQRLELACCICCTTFFCVVIVSLDLAIHGSNLLSRDFRYDFFGTFLCVVGILVLEGVVLMRLVVKLVSFCCIILVAISVFIADIAKNLDVQNSALRFCTILFCCLVVFICSYINEKYVRQLFYNWLSTRGRLIRTERDVENLKTDGSTALEALIDALREGATLVSNVKKQGGGVEREDLDLISLIFEKTIILASNENLYAATLGTSVKAEDRELLRAYGVTTPLLPSYPSTSQPMVNVSLRSTHPSRISHTLRSRQGPRHSSISVSFGAGPGPFGTSGGLRRFPSTSRLTVAEEKWVESTTGDNIVRKLQNFTSSFGTKWHVDFLDLNSSEYADGRILLTTGLAMLTPYFTATDDASYTATKEVFPLASSSMMIKAPREVVGRFLLAMEEGYNKENSYHNRAHAAQVMHSTMCLVRLLGIVDGLTSVEVVGLLVASMGHDLGHPSRTNAFLINTAADIAITYNDISVLENFHAASTFRILRRKECNIFAEISLEEWKHIRRKMIDLILATDMASHFEKISFARVRRAAADFDILQNEDDMWLAIKLCIKAGDLSHAALFWSQHVLWSQAIASEFYQQGDEEFSLGIPISPLCDRAKHSEVSFAKGQQGFLEFCVKPLFKELSELEEDATVLYSIVVNVIDQNIKAWSQRQRTEEPKEEDHQILTIRPQDVSPSPRATSPTPSKAVKRTSRSNRTFRGVTSRLFSPFPLEGGEGHLAVVSPRKKRLYSTFVREVSGEGSQQSSLKH